MNIIRTHLILEELDVDGNAYAFTLWTVELSLYLGGKNLILNPEEVILVYGMYLLPFLKEIKIGRE